MISSIFAVLTLIVIVILALFGFPSTRGKYADMSATGSSRLTTPAYMDDLEAGTSRAFTTTDQSASTVTPKSSNRRPRRRDAAVAATSAADARADDTEDGGKRVKFNMYNTERRFGKKSGATISTAVVKAAA